MESVDTHRWTRQQYEQMVDAGVLTTGNRVERIEGRIVPTSPRNSRHVPSLEMTRRALDPDGPASALIRAQYPLTLGAASASEPGVAVVPDTIHGYVDRHPSDALPVAEGADSSLAKGREPKRLLYAQHGVPACWIINLVDQRLEVYRDPASGDYASTTTLGRNDTVTPHFIETVLSVADLIPA